MIGRLALRTLGAHPIRTAVLAAGFGVGVSVMVILLGVAEVVLEQARAPQLAGGGDIVVTGASMDKLEAARLVLAGSLTREPLASQVRAASPISRGTLYLVGTDGATPLEVQAGIPSLERALGDGEVSGIAAWQDTEDDRPWAAHDPGDALRSIDGFHAVPDVPARAASWAEWLYFNGRSEHVRFYLTFLAGPRTADGRRSAGVRLQLEHHGRMESYSDGALLTEEAVSQAPDLAIGRSRIRLRGMRYDIHLDLASRDGRRVTGDLTVTGIPGRQLPPIELTGAGGWRSGYVVPVMAGTADGALVAGGTRVSLSGASGYHDHNWGFWEGVSWQWGQVQHGDLSFVFGRVFPPPDAADPARVPGFLGAIGPNGPMGYATGVTITETDDPATHAPARIVIEGRSPSLTLKLDLGVESTERNRLAGPMSTPLTFLQMRGRYAVTGSVGGTPVNFTAAGSAETFRGD